jgi:hypothetical protein
MSTATTGTGTITLGTAQTGYITFAQGGIADASSVTYTIIDGNNFEVGRGTYTSSGTTLSRDTVLVSLISGTSGTTKLTLSGTATVFVTQVAEDVVADNMSNTFTANQIISVTDNTNAALRITQTGTGNALLVEDNSNPDSTPVVITADGNMSIGATSATAKLEVIGSVVNSITALGTEDAATLAVTNTDVSGLGRITKTLYQIGNLSLASVAAVYSAFNGSGDIGGDLVFGTQTNLAGGVVERFRISKDGAFGISGANYGTSGQFIKSAGSAAAPSWASIANTDVSGLGTMSTQNANSVAITGGSITGITDLTVADGGTGASTLTGYVKGSGTAALTASATIPNTDITGLGTMSTQAASSVAITGGSITGITDLAVADGGTGVSSLTAYAVLAGGTTSTGAVQTVSGLGTSGQVLTSNGSGALPTWVTPSSGIWTHIATSTASTSSAIVFSNLSDYEMLRLSFYNVRPTTDDSSLRLTLSSDNGSTFITTATYTDQGVAGVTRFNLADNATNDMGNQVADGPASGTLIIGNFNQASKTYMMSTCVFGNPSGAIISLVNNGGQTGATAMNAFRIFVSSGGTDGTIATGTFVLEGLIQ